MGITPPHEDGHARELRQVSCCAFLSGGGSAMGVRVYTSLADRISFLFSRKILNDKLLYKLSNLDMNEPPLLITAP